MSIETLPLDLYKANVELQLRITRLLQESSHRWLESLQQASSESVAETTAEIESLLRTGNWQALAALPSESFWRVFQYRLGDTQTINQIAFENQVAFATGLQQALENWQKAVAGGLGGANAGLDLFKQWNASWVPNAQGKGKAAKKG